MTNKHDQVSSWMNVGGDPFSKNIHSGNPRNVSSWFPRYEENETPKNNPQNYLVPSEKNSPNRNQNNDAIANSIIRVFAGEPQRYAPKIESKRSDGLFELFGRGFNAQGPATHSNTAPHRPSQSSGNQGSLIDFFGNPFGKPNSSTSAKECLQANKTTRRVHQYV